MARKTQTQFAGSLADVSIGDLFQTLEMAAKASRVDFDTDVGTATVWFREREVIGAQCGGITGADAIYRVAMADEGSFIANFKEEDVPNPLQLSPQRLLMEAARRRDEWLDRAGEGLRPATRVAVLSRFAAEPGRTLSDDEQELVARIGHETQLVELIPPGDDEAHRHFRRIRDLLAAGVITVVERPPPLASSILDRGPEVYAPPPPSFWVTAAAAHVVLSASKGRALAQTAAVAVMLLGVILGLAWWSGGVLFGGLLLGWALLLLGHAASSLPQLPLRRPKMLLCEPVVIVAGILDRLGLKIEFIGRGRALASRGS